MENVYENVRRELSPENVKEMLQVMVERLHLPENETRICTAKDQAGDDMVEVMRSVFPIVLEVQIGVIAKFGFVATQEGLKDFLIRVNQVSGDNEEVRELLVQIRDTYLPGFTHKGDRQQGSGASNTSVRVGIGGSVIGIAGGTEVGVGTNTSGSA